MSKLTIKSAVFDLEGNLIDVERAHHEAYIMVAADYGLKLTIKEAIEKIPDFIGGADLAAFRGILSMLGRDGYDKKEFEAFTLQKMKYYNKILEQMDIVLRPGSLRVIRWFQNNDFWVLLGSGTPNAQAAVFFEKTGLDKIIGRQNIVLRNDFKNSKPAPDCFLETAKRAGVDPKEQLIFEDSAVGIRAAIAAGSIAVAMPVYSMPSVIKSLVDAGAIRIFMDWREICTASLIRNLQKSQ